MANTPLVVGQTAPAFSWTWKDDVGKAEDISGATITVTFTKAPEGTSRPGDGTLTITDGPNGKLTYQQSANDMATAGTFLYRYKAVLVSNKILFSDQQELVIVLP